MNFPFFSHAFLSIAIYCAFFLNISRICKVEFVIVVWLLQFSGFMVLMYVFETYLDLRQHSALKLPTLPKTLEGVISQEKFEKSRAYSLDKRFVISCNSPQFNTLINFSFSSSISLMFLLVLLFISATSILFMNLWLYCWILPFYILGYCLGSGR